jgi:hypothetical protein
LKVASDSVENAYLLHSDVILLKKLNEVDLQPNPKASAYISELLNIHAGKCPPVCYLLYGVTLSTTIRSVGSIIAMQKVSPQKGPMARPRP